MFETNVFGVIAITQAMLPLLREAPSARIVNVSSGSGSLTLNADPSHPHRALFGPSYSTSKTALNAITLAFAIELDSTPIKVNAACPGFTATNLNNFAGTPRSNRLHVSPCASHSSTQTVRWARSRTRTARFRGDAAGTSDFGRYSAIARITGKPEAIRALRLLARVEGSFVLAHTFGVAHDSGVILWTAKMPF